MDVKRGAIMTTIWINCTLHCTWRKAIRRVWKILNRTHNNLNHLMNKSCLINYVLEKSSIKLLWTLTNS